MSFSAFAVDLKNDTPPSKDVDNLFDLYYNDREYFDKVFADRQKIIGEYYEATFKMTIEEAEAYGPLVLDNVFTDSDEFSDDDLKGIVDERVEYCGWYRQNILNVINNANINREEAIARGEHSNGFYCLYQQNIADDYENVLNRAPDIGFEYIRGWDTLFLSDMMNLFLVISVIVIACSVFSHERETGFLGVLRVLKRGRGKTAAVKISLLLILVFAVVLIYIGATVLIIALTVGFSSGLNYIQAITQFLYAPYALTMFEYLFIFAGAKILSLALLALVVSLISQLLASVELIYVGAGALYGLSYIFMLLPDTNFLYHSGFASLMYGNSLFLRTNLANIFGIPIRFVHIILVIYVALIILFTVLTYLHHTKFHAGELKRLSLSKIKSKINFKLPVFSRKTRKYPASLLYYEGYKQLISSRLIFILVLLIGVQFIVAQRQYDKDITRTEEYYLTYLEEVKGEYTESTAEFIKNEGEFISRSMAQLEDAEKAYAQGLITDEQYDEILKDYYYSIHHWDAFNKLSAQQEYILDQKEKTGIDAWFIATRSWNSFFTSGVSYPLIIFIILLSANVFSGEYKGASKAESFAAILRSTRSGRRKTFSAKFVSAIVLSFIGSALFLLTNTATYIKYNGLRDLNAPLSSVEAFADLGFQMTIGTYLLIYLVTVILSSVILTIIICAVSELTRNTLSTLCISFAILFLPNILTAAQIKWAKYLDVLKSISGHDLWLASNSGDWLHGSFASGLVVLAVMLITAVPLTVIAYKKHVKH